MQYFFVLSPSQGRAGAAIVVPACSATSSFEQRGSEAPLAALDRPVWRWLAACRALTIAGNAGRCACGEVRATRALGVKPFHDADEDPQREGHGPAHVIEANAREVERLLGRLLRDQGSRTRSEPGVSTVVISTGGRSAVHAGPGRAWRVHVPSLERPSNVGSGKAMAAEMAVERASGGPIEAGLEQGVATESSASASPRRALGTRPDVPALLPRVVVEEIP